jgi:hypothetical protein
MMDLRCKKDVLGWNNNGWSVMKQYTKGNIYKGEGSFDTIIFVTNNEGTSDYYNPNKSKEIFELA